MDERKFEQVVEKTEELLHKPGATEKIEAWVQVYGSCRDALNVALARLDLAQQEAEFLRQQLGLAEAE